MKTMKYLLRGSFAEPDLEYRRTMLGWAVLLFVLTGSQLLQAQTNVTFTDVSREAQLSTEKTGSWGRPVWGDLNNDGLIDVIIPQHVTPDTGGLLHFNDGLGGFQLAPNTGVVHPNEYSVDWHGFSLIDLNGDRNLDLYVCNGGGNGGALGLKQNGCFLGNGNGTFVDMASQLGTTNTNGAGRVAFAFDSNGDNLLDLLIVNHTNKVDAGDNAQLLVQGIDGAFSPVAGAAGIVGPVPCARAAMTDWNNDRMMDFCFDGNGFFQATATGNYQPISKEAIGLNTFGAAGFCWADYNNDGWQDVYVYRDGQKGLTNTLYRNNGNGTFTDVTIASGLPTALVTAYACWADVDNDGDLDILLLSHGADPANRVTANVVYYNNGSGTFRIGFASALAQNGLTELSAAASWVDYNGDGFLDCMIKSGYEIVGDLDPAHLTGSSRLYKNSGNTNKYLSIQLVGPSGNSPGIGSTVTVRTGTGSQFQLVTGEAAGWGQDTKPLHFGLKRAASATVEVVFPDGRRVKLTGVAANQKITIAYPESAGTP